MEDMRPDDPEEEEAPAMPGPSAYVLLWVVLLCLTGLNIVATRLLTGWFKAATSVLIATIEVLLIFFFFMNLKYTKDGVKTMMLVVLGTFMVLVWLVFSDVAYRG